MYGDLPCKKKRISKAGKITTNDEILNFLIRLFRQQSKEITVRKFVGLNHSYMQIYLYVNKIK